MKTWLAAIVLLLLAATQAEESYLVPDATAIKRFKEELDKLGVSLPAVEVPEEPVKRSAPTVKAPAGDFLGYWSKTQFGRPIAAFEGIPYAKPPVGPLRFKEAEALPPLPNPINATKVGSPCAQVFGAALGQEDCLFINVYVPRISKWPESKSLPVIFSVHGGGFIVGWGDTIQPGVFLEKDVVLVTFNYRLGPLGFLTTEDGIIPANLGLKDQVAALRWTVENIAFFGGNPQLITVAGMSAGAASTEFLMLSPLTKGLIHRAISSSGSAYAPWALSPLGEMRQNVRKAAELINCPAEPSSKLLTCLLEKTAAEISALGPKMAAWKQTLVVPFKIVVEGDIPGALLPKHPSKLFANRSNDIPLLTGIVSEEGTIFGTFGLFNNIADLKKFDESFATLAPPMLNLAGRKQTSKDTLGTLRRAYLGPGPLSRSQALLATTLFGDVNFMWPAVKSVLSHTKGAKSPVYFYYFNYEGSCSLMCAWGRDTSTQYGVNHGDDLVYLTPYQKSLTPTDLRMSMVYSELYMNFARDGVPSTNLANVTWTPVTTGDKDMNYLHIYSPLKLQMKKNLFPERWTLLKTLYESDSA